MTLNKQPALDAIEKEQNTILHVADEIWDYAELSLQEFRSAKLYCEVLKQEGFRVDQLPALLRETGQRVILGQNADVRPPGAKACGKRGGDAAHALLHAEALLL